MKPYLLTISLNPSLDIAWRIAHLQKNDVSITRQSVWVAGGKANNVARVASRLGIPVIASGIVAGPTGHQIIERLQTENIVTKFLEIEGNTRACLVVHSDEDGSITELREPGPHMNETTLEQFLKHLKPLLTGAQMVVVSGSLAPGLPKDSYYQILKAIKNTPILLDTSGEALAEGLKAHPEWIKPNYQEAQELLQHTTSDPRSTIAELRKRGARGVLLSLGPEGLIASASESETFHLSSPGVRIINPVGSGDALVGGFVTALWRGLSFSEASRYAVSAGAANVQNLGIADAPPEDIQALLSRVRIKTLH